MPFKKENIETGIFRGNPQYGPEDHGIFTCMVFIDYDSGSTQGFGGLALGKSDEGETDLAKDYVKSLCETFGVRSLVDLKGKKCKIIKLATKGFGWGDNIDGVESIDTGKRFMLQDWRQKHFPKTPNVLDEKIQYAEDRVKSLKRNLFDAENDLYELRQLKESQ